MQHLLLIILHVVRSLSKLLKPDGAKALVAENFLLKHQLLIARRSRRRAPNLRFSDRFLFGLGSLFLRPRRLLRTAILIKPSTLLRCHQPEASPYQQGLALLRAWFRGLKIDLRRQFPKMVVAMLKSAVPHD